MLSGEKFKKEILEICNCDFGFNKRDNKIMLCNTRLCGLCSFSQKNRKVYEPSCSVAKMKWLLSEYKEPVKLTRMEYEFLKYILNHTEYKYIARDRLGAIFVYENKPEKHVDTWRVLINGGGYTNLTIFDELFKFINWLDLEPTSIQEVLDNCEVVEDD